MEMETGMKRMVQVPNQPACRKRRKHAGRLARKPRTATAVVKTVKSTMVAQRFPQHQQVLGWGGGRVQAVVMAGWLMPAHRNSNGNWNAVQNLGGGTRLMLVALRPHGC
jgi:hypothetical protein